MIGKYIKFVASRAIGTGVDTLVLWLCSRFIFGGGYWATYIISPFISFEVATMSNFLCSYYWIWSSRITTKNNRSFWRHFIGFNLSSGAGFLVKMAFLLLFERLFGWNVVVCNLAALIISGVLNFFLSEVLVFRKPTPRPEHEVLGIDDLATLTPTFSGPVGQILGRIALSFCGMGRINRLYDSIYSLSGPDAARGAIEYVGCNYLVGNVERLDNLPNGAFITISNHPYGALDGLIVVDLIGHKRPDLKVMVNEILARVEPLSDNFVAVTPTGTTKTSATATTLAGIRTSLAHIKSGHPMSFFPSGAVSDLHLPSGNISDRPWQESLIRLIQKAKVPVVPIRFADHNSLLYYLLGLIDWRVRLLRLPREVLNKGKGRHRVIIGNTISIAQQQECNTTEQLTNLLRNAVYNMPIPDEFTPSSKLQTSLGIVEPQSTNNCQTNI